MKGLRALPRALQAGFTMFLVFLVAQPLALGMTGKERFDLFAPDVPLKEAILVAGFQSGEMVVFVSSVRGRVNIRRNRVTFSEALDLILKDTGITWTEQDGTYYIGSPPTDSPTYARLSEAETVTLTHRSCEEVTEQLPDLADRLASRDPGTLVLFAPERERRTMVERIREADLPKEHILVQAVILEMSEQAVYELEGEFSFEQNGGLLIGELTAGGSLERLERIDAQLQLLEARGEVKIRTQQSMVVLDGEEGRTWTGNVVYYRLRSDTPAGETASVETVEVGAGLTARPRWIEGGRVIVDFTMEFKDLREGVDFPEVWDREISSRLITTEGVPVLVGRVIQTEEAAAGRKSPVRRSRRQERPDTLKVMDVFVFLQAERHDPRTMPVVARVRSDDAWIGLFDRREVVSEFAWSAELAYFTLPILGDTPQAFAGVAVTGQVGETLALRGKVLRSLNDEHWLGEAGARYRVMDELTIGLEVRTLVTDVTRTVFTGYLEEQRTVDEHLDMFLRLGIQTSGREDLSFASLGLVYQEDDYGLTGELKYQWAGDQSNWRASVEGHVSVDEHLSLYAGYRDIVAGESIEPFDSMDFRGGYVGASVSF